MEKNKEKLFIILNPVTGKGKALRSYPQIESFLFDVDYTLVRKSISYYFLLEALKEGILSFGQLRQLPIEWIRYKFGLIHQDFIEKP
jgi:hypothetical protein